jgi:membrane protease YdiL (CAAX protease family)
VTAVEPEQRSHGEFVASRLHTAAVLLVLVVLAAGGLLRALRGEHEMVGPEGRLPLYGRIVAIQLVLFWLVRVGIRRSGSSVRALIDQRPWNAARLGRLVGVAVVGWIFWMAASAALSSLLRPSPEELRAILNFLPRGTLEKLCWVVFSVVTTLCEEVLYRGYLMKQFRALTGSSVLALFLQAAVFAIGHVSLGTALVISVSFLALFLGILAMWQQSLLPGMIVHAGVGLIGGLLAPS